MSLTSLFESIIFDPDTGTLVDSSDPDEMPLNAVFHQGLNYMLRYHNLENSTCFLWIFYVFVLSCVCYVFVCVCLYVLCGHLLGKG